MNKPVLATLTAALALGACAGHAAVPAAPPAPRPFAPATLVPEAVAPPVSPQSVAPIPVAPPRRPERRVRSRRSASPAGVRVAAANRAALREPARDYYSGAVQVYPWIEGSLYRLYTAPEQVSDIALQPGEALVSVAAGDTVRWVIGDTTSGAGGSRRVHILVKPSAAGLATNLLISTDRRVYHVQLESSSGGAMASIAWSYPDDALLAVRRAEAAAESAPVDEGLAIERLNFGYSIEGDRPPWRPVRAFDDGRQVFIEFPPSLATGEAPPLFVRGEGGGAELVNYRLRGRYYVVDRLFSAAELRLGGAKQQIVRILKTGGVASRKRKGKSS